MISRINVDQTDDMSVVTTVATELFSDGITNWGRIASLLAFGAVLSKHLHDSGRSQCVSVVGDKISSYLLFAQKDWLLKNKAWVSLRFEAVCVCVSLKVIRKRVLVFWLSFCVLQDGFVEFFHVQDTEAAVRNALMAIGSVATFGAALVYWIRWIKFFALLKKDSGLLRCFWSSTWNYFIITTETIFI